MLTNLRLKILDFIRRNKWKVLLFIIFWAVLVVISQVLANMKNEIPVTTFRAYEPIIENGETMPAKWQSKVEEMVEEYMGYCNNKEYEKAYNMITEPCREVIYPTLEDFKAYVDYVFSSKRLYSIKNYSNRDNVYIYRLRIFEDIMATGLTYSDTFKYFEEKISFTEENGKLLMGVKDYISQEALNAKHDDQYIRINITNKYITYDEEIYTIEFQNKTQYDIVISNKIGSNELELVTTNETIDRTIDENWEGIYIPAKSKTVVPVEFTKFYDKGAQSASIKFNNVRIMRSYSANASEQEMQSNTIDVYSITIPLK